jgi:hypothetical protein
MKPVFTLQSERNIIKNFLRDFHIWVDNPSWGKALWIKTKQHEISAKLKTLDPDTVSSNDITKIMETPYYTSPWQCSFCRTHTYDLVEIVPAQKENTTLICRDCLVSAQSVLTTQDFRVNNETQ